MVLDPMTLAVAPPEPVVSEGAVNDKKQRSLYQRLEVAQIVRETHDSLSIVFSQPEKTELFAYRPGQFLTLRIPSEQAQPVVRCYSLASAPQVDALMKVTVKRVDGGVGSNWICESLQPGDVLEVLPPSGVFTPKSLDTDFLLFAGGSGITPVMSILKSCLKRGRGRIQLFYANRNEASVIFRDELKALVQAHPDRLSVVHWLESVQGRASAAQLAHTCSHWKFSEVFVCGPGPFMDTVEQAMAQLGVDAAKVHVERFVSLEGDPGLVDEMTADTSQGVALDVELDGRVHQLTWPQEVTLLDLMLHHGLQAPFSCKEGRCSACMCQVTKGQVQMDRNEILNQDDLAEGWVLACQARPQEEAVAISFDQC